MDFWDILHYKLWEAQTIYEARGALKLRNTHLKPSPYESHSIGQVYPLSHSWASRLYNKN